MLLNTSLMKSLNKIKYFVFFCFLCMLFFGVYFFINKYFLIKNIQLNSDKKLILINKDKLINTNLLFINEEKISKQIVKDNYLLKTAIVEKILPSTLKISVSIYEPCVSLIVNIGFFNLSCDGRILQKIKEGKPLLPQINYYQKLNFNSFQTGDWIDFKDIQQALYFFDKLQQINLSVLTIDIKGQDMLVFNLKDEKTIVFSIKKKKESQDYQLELIVKQFKIEGKDYKKIDLRFNKPIVQF